MPFDGQTYKTRVRQPKVDPTFTSQEILDWAKQQDPKKRYDFCDNRNCIVAQFLKGTGRAKHPTVDPYNYWLTGNARDPHYYEIPEPVVHAAHADTFGGFVRSLQRLLRG